MHIKYGRIDVRYVTAFTCGLMGKKFGYTNEFRKWEITDR